MHVIETLLLFSILLQFIADEQVSTATKTANLNLKRQRGGRTRTKQTKPKARPGVVYELVEDANAPDEQRLIMAMLNNYEPASRPVYNASNVVLVKFGLTLAQIFDMDEVNQVLTTNVWLEQEWPDERLRWDPSNYSGLEVLRIPCQRIWLPDIVLYNSADDFTEGFMQSRAMVRYTGNVFWPPPARLRSSCKIDITYFPFDDQRCIMKFGSWTYDGLQVDVTNRSHFVDLSNYIFSGEWELLDISVKRNEVYYACCAEPYPDVTFVFVMRRRTLYYLFNIICPCLWLTVLSLLGFWLPPESGEKITLGITVLLAFSVFMLLIAERIPATSEFVPLIGLYLTVTMAMTSMSIMLTVFVLQLHHAGPHQSTVPSWIRTVIVGYAARLLCMRSHVGSYYETPSTTTTSVQETTSATERGSGMIRKDKEMVKDVDAGRGSAAFGLRPESKTLLPSVASKIPSINIESGTVISDNNTLQRRQSNSGYTAVASSASTGCSTADEADDQSFRFAYADPRPSLVDGLLGGVGGRRRKRSSAAGDGHEKVVARHLKLYLSRNRVEQDFEKVVARHLKLYLSRNRAEQDFEDVMNEWRLVACITDRLLFWLFLIGSVFSTVFILIVMPMMKPNLIDGPGFH